MRTELRKKVTKALQESGRNELAAEFEAELDKTKRQDEEYLTSGQAADVLGVSSVNTVKNWFEGGAFPGAFKTEGGHWRFPAEEVKSLLAKMRQLEEKNKSGDLSPPVLENPEDPPLI